jgi:hypothetical protein
MWREQAPLNLAILLYLTDAMVIRGVWFGLKAIRNTRAALLVEYGTCQLFESAGIG